LAGFLMYSISELAIESSTSISDTAFSFYYLIYTIFNWKLSSLLLLTLCVS
jgi:hypothetical protein